LKGERMQISLQFGEGALPVPSWQSMEIALLKEMGANGGSIDTERAIKNLIRYFPELTENELAVLNRSGETRWANRVRWARQALVGKNQLDSSTHGIWRITAGGL